MKKTILILATIITLIIGININSYSYATNAAKTHTAGEVITEADGFIKNGEADADSIIGEKDLKNLSDTLYNILLVIGIIAAVIIGAIMAIKFITAGVEGKAEVKQALLAYGIGCAIVFGAFTIWKVVVLILQGL